MSPKKSDSVDRERLEEALLNAESYRKAYRDSTFLEGFDGRELRLLAEYWKTERALEKANIGSTVVVFGSARILPPDVAQERLKDAEKRAADAPTPRNLTALERAKQSEKLSVYYRLAREFGELVASKNDVYNEEIGPNGKIRPTRRREFVVCTGGGPGIMEAANRGAFDAGEATIGLNISLPFEQRPNPFISPEFCFQFHYFAIRKLHFLLRAKALVVFPGGFGTFDELFEALTLRQTGCMQPLPIVMFGQEFWEKTLQFEHLVETGVISLDDLKLFHYVETPEEAWDAIEEFYRNESLEETWGAVKDFETPDDAWDDIEAFYRLDPSPDDETSQDDATTLEDDASQDEEDETPRDEEVETSREDEN